MTNKIKKIKKEINAINQNLLNFLNKQIGPTGFPLENYYGETHAAAAFSISERHIGKIPLLVEAYDKKEKSSINTHSEFNNYALQQVNPNHYKRIHEIYIPLKFNNFFYRKVTNWMLLRALIYLKANKKMKGHFITKTTLFFQQDKEGILYDNRIYHKKELAYQYHAFATCLLGEIAQITKNKFYLKRFLRALNYLLKVTSSIKIFEKKNLRGSKQIFGYSSAICALAIGYKLTKNKNCLRNIEILLIYLKKFQRKNGSLPLALTKKEFEIKRYTNNTKPLFWESYNRYYDYLGFTAFYLAKTLELIKEYN
jgi:hypothetical protein